MPVLPYLGTLPTVGEHTRQVLAGLGLGGAEVDALAAAGAIQ